MLVAVLSAAGHKPTTVENGQDAWDSWLLARSGVVISDWQMPEVDGLELCRRLREEDADGYTYFILVTSRSG